MGLRLHPYSQDSTWKGASALPRLDNSLLARDVRTRCDFPAFAHKKDNSATLVHRLGSVTQTVL